MCSACNISKWLAILLLCCCCQVECQPQTQQQQHQYQQLQYQMQQQQQQQYEYQQQMQQQQQNQFQQQYQKQQQQLQLQQQQQQQLQQQQEEQELATGPMSLALQQQQQQRQHQLDAVEPYLPPTQQSQMLQTGISLVVDDDSQDSIYATESHGQKEFAGNNDGLGVEGELQQPPRRRPGTRKRKRRPQLAVAEDSLPPNEDERTKYWRGQFEDDALLPAVETNRREDTRGGANRRRKQPAIREPLAALEKEQKLYEMRDRQRQDYGGDSAVVGGGGNKSYRRPYSQAKKELHSTSGTAETLLPTAGSGGGTGGAKGQADLKNILKNSGGMSLSEILQQKNLSLDDLLKGKQKALLALQTTAASPAHKTETGGGGTRAAKPVRRLPTAYLGGPPAPTAHSLPEDARTSSEEGVRSESDEIHAKNKLKFPTLQRQKLFGSASRGAATIQGHGESTTRKSAANATTTTSTSTTTTTPRVPLYKKRLQQRPTLKSPTLLKGTATKSTTAKETEIPTSMETLMTTIKPMQEREKEEELSEIDEDEEISEVTENAEDLNEADEEKLEAVEEKLNVTEVKPMTLIVASSTTRRMPATSTTTTTTTTTTKTTATTPTTTTHKPTTRRRGNPAETPAAPKQTNLRLKTTLSERVQETNFIENDEAPTKSTKATSTPTDSGESNYTDDLENFFEDEPADKEKKKDSKSKSKESTSSEKELEQEESKHGRTDQRRRPTTAQQPAISLPSFTSYYDEIPDFDGVDDRTDLLELIEDRRSSNRLFKVLEQRNMTLEELIEHRKRGSSQLHLSTIVQNRSRFFPGQKVVLHDNMDIVTAFENFPHFNLMDLKSVKPDDIKTDSQGSSYFTSIIDIEPTDEIYKDGGAGGPRGGDGVAVGGGGGGSDARGPTYTQPQRSEKSLGFFPSWKTLALASLATTSRDPNIKRNPFFLPQPKLLLEHEASQELEEDDDDEDDSNLILNNKDQNNTNSADSQKSAGSSAAIIDTVEAIENEVARAHDLLDLELSGHGFKRSPAAAAASISNQKHSHGNLYTNMPAGIRSAIVASAAIVLTSLATFMVIFVVCRWKQRKRRKTNYMKTYNAMKSKLPTLATSSRRSSLRNMEEMMGGCVVSTVAVSASASPQPTAVHHHHQLQRQSSLLFPPTTRGGCRDSIKGNCASSGSTNALLSGRVGGLAGLGGLGGALDNSGGIGSATGSTTSLALSLQSAHNISTTKLNTMDPNSPEVQEYLFDTLRKSF